MLRPVELTLGAVVTALPVTVLVVLPGPLITAPHPVLLAALAGLAAASLLLCGAPYGTNPYWWSRRSRAPRPPDTPS